MLCSGGLLHPQNMLLARIRGAESPGGRLHREHGNQDQVDTLIARSTPARDRVGGVCRVTGARAFRQRRRPRAAT
jgi:hypothetical protein